MDLFLIAADPSWSNLWGWGHIVQMAIGLGIVIFVHELGHFLAAKACGVKAEKFYVGFDVPMPKIGPFQIPSKFFSFQWGETEYGLGIIPLGGYVKMLGQDDNPANAEKEAKKTRVKRDDADTEDAGDGDVAARESAEQSDHHESITDVDLEPQPLAENVDYELDPRSYTAKNVPQRMLIISAGVIMNVIFAVVFATIAYDLGVPYTPSVIGGVTPGGPAWRANLPVGNRILQVGDGDPREHFRFTKDFHQEIILDGKQGDVRLHVREGSARSTESNPATGEVTVYTLTPDMRDAGSLLGKMPYVGVIPPATNVLGDKPLLEGFPAFGSELEGGDIVTAGTVDGETTDFANYWDMNTFLAQHVDSEITLHVDRIKQLDDDKTEVTQHSATLKRRPLQRLGIILTMGPVTAIQKDSIAEQAGVQVGDVLKSIDGKSLGDPMVAPDIIRRLAGQEVTLTVMREGDDGKRSPIDITLTPRPVTTYQSGRMGGEEPMLVDALGLTFDVDSTISALATDGDARKSLKVGDKIVRVQLLPASDSREDQEKLTKLGFSDKEISLIDPEKKVKWPSIGIGIVQWMPAGAKLRVTVDRAGQEHTADLAPYDSEAFAFGARGISLKMDEDTHTAKTWGEAFSLGVRETKEGLFLVVKFLKRLVTGDIPITGLGGPGTIAAAASSEASVGTSRLLIFLTMLSANLAVVNFLPIPVLDGGHMMFLAYEGIFRRPVNEAWQIRLSLLGFAFLLCLMAFVIGLDIVRFSGMLES